MSPNRFNPSDEAWGALLDDDILTEKRRAAETRFRDLSGQQISLLRKRVKTDLLALAGILEFDLLSVDLHGHYAAWLKKMWGQRYRMTLLPRDHFKSTTNTIVDSIQMVLPNEAGVTERPYCLGPNGKILIAHENRESASRFLYGLTQAFRAKPWMLALFPDMIPSPRIQRMNKWELELPRTEYHNEPTFDTIGVSGAAQSRHYNWLKLDDLVGESARDSETVMKTTLMWFDNVNSLLTRLKIDGWDLIGTRWSAIDVYAHAISMYGVDKARSILRVYGDAEIERIPEGQLVVYARGAIENGLPIFPEEFAISDLNRIRRNPRVWAAQYANNPRSGELTRLDPAWLKHYNIGVGDRLIIFEGEESRTVRTSEMDRVILIDPSVGENKSSDESGIIVTGTDKKMNVYVLEAYRKRLKPPELIDEMFRLYTKWNPRLISIESVAFSAMLKYWFDQKCRELGVYPNIYDYKPGSNRSKVARIEGLSNYGAGGQLYILEGMHQLRDEWEWFPLGEFDHLLDALAQGPEVWSPVVIEQAREMEKVTRRIFEDRDELTGYSAI